MAQFTDQHRRMLQRLQAQEDWQAVEAFVADYLLRNFAMPSAKRDTEFETIWWMAENEGGKRHLQQVMREMETEASKVETR